MHSYTHANVRTHAHTHTRTHAHTHTRTHVHTQTCEHTHTEWEQNVFHTQKQKGHTKTQNKTHRKHVKISFPSKGVDWRSKQQQTINPSHYISASLFLCFSRPLALVQPKPAWEHVAARDSIVGTSLRRFKYAIKKETRCNTKPCVRYGPNHGVTKALAGDRVFGHPNLAHLAVPTVAR
jgi:hypothetical protein